MVRVLIVCLGNIHRSPLAHGVVQQRIEQRGLQDRITVDSCGTSRHHVGEQAGIDTRRLAAKRGLDLEWHRSRQLADSDFFEFDVLIPMDTSNESDIHERMLPNSEAVVRRFMDFVPNAPGPDMPDPYYTHGFETVHDLVQAGADPLIDWLLEQDAR